jgi:O-antigen ligase
MTLLNFISSVSQIIIIIFPFLLISGPFLPDAACVLIGIFYLIFAIKKKNLVECKNYIIYFLILIYIYINLNSFFSFNPKISFGTSLPFFRIILFILGLSYFLNKYKKLKIYFFYSSCAAICLLLIDSLVQYFYGANLIGLKLLDETRVSSFFGKELIMGSFVARILPLILALSYFIDSIHTKNIRTIILFFSGILILLSGERTSFVLYLFSFFLFLFLDCNNKKIFIYLLIILLPLFFLFSFNSKPLKRIFYHTYNQINETGNIFNFSYRHNLHFYTANKMFQDSKIIGQGVKSFRFLCSNPEFTALNKILEDKKFISPKNGYVYFSEDNGTRNLFISPKKKNNPNINDRTFDESLHTFPIQGFYYQYVENGTFVEKNQKLFVSYEFKDGCNTHPHNFYWQFLSELGLLGFFLFFFIFIFSAYKIVKLSLKKIKKNLFNREKFEAFIFLSIFITFFPMIPSGNFFHNWLLIIIHLPIGFYLAYRHNK